jgi:3-oxoacyl-[acyl-carrier-protein] synthase II
MKAFIKGTAIISPQKTFGITGYPQETVNYQDAAFLKCIEPPYKEFLDPMVSRRMSRIVKMAVCGALSCLRNAAIDMPDAIITGTGLGCLEDTEKFLGSVYANEEHLMNPTPFIQSTHNTVSGAIALAIKCHGYNATYAHRGFSFESAIQDALMQVAENKVSNVLAGGFDELTPDSFTITRRLGLWKTHTVNSQSMIADKSRGTLPGEGLAFFVLSGNHDRNDLAQLISMKTIFKPRDDEQIEDELIEFIRDSGLAPGDIDLAILGMNGDSRTDHFYNTLIKGLLEKTPLGCFKHLCGEYDTASSFALWLAAVIIHARKVPEVILSGVRTPGRTEHVLIYNHLRGVNHTMYLLSSC